MKSYKELKRKSAMINLTKYEKDVIVAIAENAYSNVPGDEIWSFAIADQTKIVKKREVSGVVSSLVKKGLAESRGNDKERTVWLTPEGIAVYHNIKKEQKL